MFWIGVLCFVVGRPALDNPAATPTVEISARFDHDLEKYLAHLREIERRYEDRVVSQVTVIRPVSAAEPVES